MNEKQKLVLRKLVEENGRRYSELFRYFSYEDKFPYHLKYLVTKGLVRKQENKYFLAKEGMRATSDFDTITLEEIKTPSPKLLFLCRRKGKFLITEHFSHDKDQKRRLYMLPFASPLIGMALVESASRELKRKYQIEADLKYHSLLHQIDKTTDGEILFDDIWLVFVADVKSQGSASHYKTKHEYWLTRDKITSLANTHPLVKRYVVDGSRNFFADEEIVLNYGI